LFLQKYPDLRVIGLDRDEKVMAKACRRLDGYGNRFQAVNTWFDDFFSGYHGESPALVLFDLGISVFHYEESGRGFSFRKNESLDMRLNAHDGLSVSDIVNTYAEDRLANVIFQYGEERYSRRIAAAICTYRRTQLIAKSDELATIIWNAVPAAYRYGKLHPATRSFQALRIEVNREIDRIVPAVTNALNVLSPGGRIGVISFHSLEDRPVKYLFRRLADGCTCPPDLPRCICGGKPSIKLVTRKPLAPSEEEAKMNPPSRSAKLRVVEKLGDSNE
jgi:16S rRNA (cytosine1402-N4)-methyltransferase